MERVETTFTELVVLVAAVAGLYYALRPIQAGIERWLLRLLDPRRRGVIDAEIVPDDESKRKRKE